MMNMKSFALTAVLIALPAASAFAQHTTYSQRHSIQARQNRQQARIAKGVQDGQITPKGAAAAEKTQAKIASQENQMRAADNGHLTGADRHQLAREQDRASQNIYNRNHNQYTDPGVAPK
jgi:hypothetical protein